MKTLEGSIVEYQNKAAHIVFGERTKQIVAEARDTV